MLIISLTLAFVFLFLNVAYGYFVIAAPFAAYAIGRLMRWRVAVIGWNGLSAIRREEQLTQTEALLNREVEYVICSTEFQSRCDSTITDGLFTLAEQVVTEQETYFIYQRN